MSVLKHLYELSLVRHWFLIGCLQDGARKAALLENNNLVSHYYNDAKTMYEVFQRGLKVSGDGSLYFFFSMLCVNILSQKVSVEWRKTKDQDRMLQHFLLLH